MEEQEFQTEQEETTKDTGNEKSFRKLFSRRNIILGIIGIFFIWILLFDHNCATKQYKMTQEQRKLEDAKKDFQTKIKETNKEIEALDNDDYIETIAREKHLMKKDNEDLYMITD